jgi:hypothetical protein
MVLIVGKRYVICIGVVGVGTRHVDGLLMDLIYTNGTTAGTDTFSPGTRIKKYTIVWHIYS